MLTRSAHDHRFARRLSFRLCWFWQEAFALPWDQEFQARDWPWGQGWFGVDDGGSAVEGSKKAGDFVIEESRFLPSASLRVGMAKLTALLSSTELRAIAMDGEYSMSFVGAGVEVHYVIGFAGQDQAPGFAVGFEAHASGLTMRIETQHGGWSADFDGDDVPEIERDYVGGDEVDVVLGVDGAPFARSVGGAGFVRAHADGFSALDLNAVEALSVVEDKVVAAAVAPGLGDTESHVEGAGEECGFGGFSGELGIFPVVGMVRLTRAWFGRLVD
jgi:hypothetical protein